MRVMQFDEVGPPEVLHSANVPVPKPGSGEVLVRVQAIGVNFSEVSRRRGTTPLAPGRGFPYIPGYECSGFVEALGTGVTTFAPGDRVLVRSFPATYAEYVAVPASIVYQLPDTLDFVQAAGIAGVYSTAWQNLVNRAQLQPNETVLVQACASGVGIGNVQVAKHIGATVIGTASTDEKLEWAMQFGVDHRINYVTSDFVEETMRLTGGQGVPVVVDGVGGEVLLKSLKVLAPGGRLVTYGRAGGERQITLTLPELWFTNLTILGSGSDGVDRPTFDQLIQLVAGGELTVPVDRTWPLESAHEAHEHLESRRTQGKVVLTVE